MGGRVRGGEGESDVDTVLMEREKGKTKPKQTA